MSRMTKLPKLSKMTKMPTLAGSPNNSRELSKSSTERIAACPPRITPDQAGWPRQSSKLVHPRLSPRDASVRAGSPSPHPRRSSYQSDLPDPLGRGISAESLSSTILEGKTRKMPNTITVLILIVNHFKRQIFKHRSAHSSLTLHYTARYSTTMIRP